ncbi:NACHT domain-containing protein [Streptacidiphilus carbonis]|uniref:NACHT domain-containing protein n=1 Tax=Streptacidiphilus carbonis TaxID=105422 RepID=UPI0005A9DC01|nr:ATP-binding protein [Streptacidiphilus carbonis]
MPPKGGLPDKIGNRYEGRLAVLRLLELLDEEHDSVRMRFEHPGKDAFEWWVERDNGARVYTQVKRQLSTDDHWSVSKLVANGVLKAFGEQLRDDPAAECEFYSTLSASHLQELTESAVLAKDLQEFESVFAKAEDKKASWDKTCGVWTWWDPEESWQALKRIKAGVISERDLGSYLDVRARVLVSGVPRTVVSLLGSYLQDHLSQELTAEQVWQYLATQQMVPSDWRRDPSTRAKVNTANQRYTDGVRADRGPLAEIPRAEATRIARLLTSSEGPRIVTVTGAAGTGKSDVLGQVVEQLIAQSTVPDAPPLLVLAARLDRVGPFQDAAALGGQLGLPESPAVVLSRLADGGPALLVLDQVDAFSSASGRHPERSAAVTEAVGQAQAAGVRVLLACRTFDFNEDDRLLALSAPADAGLPFELGPLPVPEVDNVLDGAGVPPSSLTKTLRELLRTPLHLRMLVTLRQRNVLDLAGITTRLQLFNKFFDSVIEEVDRFRPNAPVEDVTGRLAEQLSRRQELNVPAALLSNDRLTVRHLISAGWLRSQAGRIGFAHEAFFDYAYAYHHMRAGLSLLDLLRSDEQYLFRRSQVRQILALEREEDRPQYLRDVRDVLTADDVRPHIKELVTAVVASVPDPTVEELQALMGLGDARSDSLAERAHALIASSPAFGGLLLTSGVVERYLADSDTADLGAWLCGMLVRNHPDLVAPLLQPHATDPAWADRIIRVINVAPLSKSEGTVALFESLIKAGGVDAARHDVFNLLYGTTGTSAPVGTRIARAYMQRRLELSGAEPLDLLGASQSAPDILATLANDAPTDFVHQVLPVVRAAGTATRTGEIADDGEQDTAFGARAQQHYAHGNHAVLSNLVRAVRTAAVAGDTATLAAVRDMAASRLAVEQVLAAAGFSSGHPGLLDEALTWLEQGQFALAQGWSLDPRGLSADVLAQVSEKLPPSATRKAQQRASSATSPVESQGMIPRGAGAQRLLRAIPAERLDPAVLSVRSDLDRALGTSSGTAAAPPQAIASRLQSPVSLNAVQAMTDDQLVQEMGQYASDQPTWLPTGTLIGGASSFAEVITTAAREDPGRFTALLERESALPAIHVTAVVQGMGANSPTAADATVSQMLRTVKAAALHADAHSNALAQLIARTAPHLTDADLAQAACTVDDLVTILRSLLKPPGPDAPVLLKELPPEPGAGEQAVLTLMEQGRDMVTELLNCVWQLREWAALDALRSLADRRAEAVAALKDELVRLAAGPDLLLRMTALQTASMAGVVNRDLHMKVVTDALDAPGLTTLPGSKLPADARILLACQPLFVLLLALGRGNYDAVDPLVNRMLDLGRSLGKAPHRVLTAVGPWAAHNAAAVTTYAAATGTDPKANAAVERLAAGTAPERLGVADALSDLLPVTLYSQALMEVLLKLCDDDNDDVAKSAGMAVRDVTAADHPNVQTLLSRIPGTRAFELNPQPLVNLAKICQQTHPGLVLDMAERFFVLHGQRAGDLSSASAAQAWTLGEIVTNIYAKDPQTATGRQALNLIDTMVLARSYGLEDRLGDLDR